MCVSRTIEALGKLLAGVFCFRKEQMAWTVQYEANELPDAATPAWTKNAGNGETEEVSPAGYFHALGLGDYTTLSYLISDSNLSDSTGFTFEARVRVLAGNTCDMEGAWTNNYAAADFSLDSGDEYIGIYTDAVIFISGSGQKYSMDTTDDYHTYRVTIKDGVSKLYVDGTLRMTATPDTATNPSPSLDFQPQYGGSSGIAVETSWDYVYYDTTGAYAPESGSNDSCYHYFV